MYWKWIGVIFFGLFLFVLGFALGGIHWSWMSEARSSEVAFWDMLGGWVSGFATLAAVVVSMVVAYLASRAGIEKLEVKFEHMYARVLPGKRGVLTDQDTVNIRVTNLRNVPTEIVAIYMDLDGASARLNIGFMKQGGKSIPHVMHRIGEEWEFAFSLSGAINLSKAMTYFLQGGEPSFKKGVFTIETTINQYELKMEKDLLHILHERYKSVAEEKRLQS